LKATPDLCISAAVKKEHLMITLQTPNKDDNRKIKRLFRSAFPPDERPPYFLLNWKAKREKAQILVAKDNNTFVGFVYLVTHLDLVYLFFLAVDESRRRCGCGSKLLTALKEKYAGKRIFLAREPLDPDAENYAQRVSRHNFYLKNGLVDLPMKIKEGPLVYDTMGIGGNISADEYHALICAWGGKLIPRLIDMRMLE